MMAGASEYWPELLKQLRRDRGWSWKQQARVLRGLAEKLNIERVAQADVASIERAIARWESGDYPYKLSAQYQLLLAHAYATSSSGQASVGPGSDLDRLLSTFAIMGVPQETQEFLRIAASSTETAGGQALLAFVTPALQARARDLIEVPSRLDGDAIRELGHTLVSVQQAEGFLPFARLQTALIPLVELIKRFLNSDVPIPIKNELYVVAAKAFAFAGRVAFELYDYDSANVFYDLALTAADELPETGATAAILTSRSMVTLHATADVDSAAGMASRAVDLTMRTGNLALRARALAVQSEMSIRSGDIKSGLRALDLAGRHLDKRSDESDQNGFNHARLHGFEALAEIELGQFDAAVRDLTDAAEALPGARNAVQRSILLADLALAHVRSGQPEAGCDVLTQSIHLVTKTRGRVATQRIHRVRRDLEPWRAERFVAELDDHLLDSLLR
jgi:tetratricopeptide (TPR) repeat protein